MTKHTPATPLPWRVGAVTPARFPAYPIVGDVIVADVSIRARGGSDKDAAYIAHAANAYQKLVDALRCMTEWDAELRERMGSKYPLDLRPSLNVRAVDARALLRELGEAE
jgi:hypothetical protein